MKAGKTIIELATEIQRQADSKRDYVASTRQIRLASDYMLGGQQSINLHLAGIDAPMPVTAHTHRQIGEFVDIPAKYYDRMRTELPGLLTSNVNAWFDKNPAPRLVRVLDGEARALLSNRYRCIDNFDLIEAVLPVLSEVPGMRIESCEVTATRMYIKAVFPRLEGEVRVGDAVQAGVVFTNSEIGLGMMKIEPMIYRLICKNGMVRSEGIDGFKKLHVGAANSAEEQVRRLLSDETKKQADRAFWMTCQDVTRASANELLFRRGLEQMRDATRVQIEDEPALVVERAAKMFSLNEAERGSVFAELLKAGDMTQYGLVNAITHTAQEVPSYDRSCELEELGGKVLTLPKPDWNFLAKKAA